MFSAWHKDIAVLGYLCNLTSRCLGFSTTGTLFYDATISPSQGVTFYAKKSSSGKTPEVHEDGTPVGGKTIDASLSRKPTNALSKKYRTKGHHARRS